MTKDLVILLMKVKRNIETKEWKRVQTNTDQIIWQKHTFSFSVEENSPEFQ